MRVGLTIAPSQDAQAIPRDGPLVPNVDLGLAQLQTRLHGTDGTRVYSYVAPGVKTTKSNPPLLRQRGTGPNFEGGAITLCTCKHHTRAHLPAQDWPGCWLAGFTSRTNPSGRHWLFYLMRVGAAFESHFELWNHLSPEARAAKSASLNRLGDVFEPMIGAADIAPRRHDPTAYRLPTRGHSHEAEQGWHKDICYTKATRMPSLLVGDPTLSFLWSTPRIYFTASAGKHPRKEKRHASLDAFLNGLAESLSH